MHTKLRFKKLVSPRHTARPNMSKVCFSSLFHHGETPSWTVFFWSEKSSGKLVKICMTSSRLKVNIELVPKKLPSILELVNLLEDLPATLAKGFRKSCDARELEWAKAQGLSGLANRISHWIDHRLEPLQDRLDENGHEDVVDYSKLTGLAYCFYRQVSIDPCWVDQFFEQETNPSSLSVVIEEWVDILRELATKCKSGEFSDVVKAYGLLSSIEAYSEAFDLLGTVVKSVAESATPLTEERLIRQAREWYSGRAVGRATYPQQFGRYIKYD